MNDSTEPPRAALGVAATTLLAVLLAAIAYGPAAAGAELLGFDDLAFFGQWNDGFAKPTNPEFLRGLAAVFDPSQPIANAYLPVAHLSLYVDFVLAGTDPLWPHLHALLLHGLVGAALVRLLLGLGLRTPAACAAGALFLVHPALAESVAWVSGRKDLLSGLFVLLALQLVVARARGARAVQLPLMVLLAALAMYSKATAVVLPFLAALVALAVDRRPGRFRLPLVALLTVLPIAAHHQSIAAAEGTLAAGSAAERLLQVPGAFVHYLATALWPTRLNVLYPEVGTLERFAGFGALGWALLAGLGALVAFGWRSPAWRLAAVGALAFGLAFLPFNTAYPASSIAAADRYLYLMLPGLALSVVVALERWLPRHGALVAGALALLLLPATWLRAREFRDDATLWRASLAVDDANAVAHLNLVTALERTGTEVSVSVAHLRRAVAVARYPIHELRARDKLAQRLTVIGEHAAAADEALAAIALAERLFANAQGGRRDEARQLLASVRLAAVGPLRLGSRHAAAAEVVAALQVDAPADPRVIAFAALQQLAACVEELRDRGESRLRDDDPRGAVVDRELAAARAAHPRQPLLALAQAEWDRARERVLSAMRHYKQAREADPGCLEAWRGEVSLLRERGLHEEARTVAEQGLRHRQDPVLRQAVALALVSTGHIEDAEIHLRAYLRAHPEDSDMARVLANVLSVRAYQRLGVGPSAREQIERLIADALHFFPEEPRAQLVLGRLARDDERLEAAAEHFRLAMTRLPDLEEPRQLYVDTLAALGYRRLLQRDDAGAGAAFRLVVEHAPPGFDHAEIDKQLGRIAGLSVDRALAARERSDQTAAIAALRNALALDPEHVDASWHLAVMLCDDADADLAEVERLCRRVLRWCQESARDAGPATLVLVTTLGRAGRLDEAKATARSYLDAPPANATPQIVEELRRLLDD